MENTNARKPAKARSSALSVESPSARRVVGDARVRITSRPLWRLRLTRELPRYLICVLALAGIVASIRFAIAPPRSRQMLATPRSSTLDRAAEGFAVLFARRYLTWHANEPDASARALAQFAGPEMESAVGVTLPASGEQRVEWAEIVQTRILGPTEHVYTVAAQTDSAGVLYLAVTVRRASNGPLELVGYPALVGEPPMEPAASSGRLREVSDPALSAVVTRALRNYLAGSASELASDLSPSAQVSLPSWTLELQSVQRLGWEPGGRSVLAIVQARDARGVDYTLAYELNVGLAQGRWEISAVQTNAGE